jgi:hypothetical protein
MNCIGRFGARCVFIFNLVQAYSDAAEGFGKERILMILGALAPKIIAS